MNTIQQTNNRIELKKETELQHSQFLSFAKQNEADNQI